jgi:hypothetical protein
VVVVVVAKMRMNPIYRTQLSDLWVQSLCFAHPPNNAALEEFSVKYIGI